MPRQFQNKLLNLMENGRIKVDQQHKQYDFELRGLKVFATSNDLSKLKPLQSWFRQLHLPRYTKSQLLDIAIKVSPKLSEAAKMIGEEVWKTKGDIHDVISTAKLVRKHDGPEEIEEILKTFKRYGDQNEM
jgi:hypothetical protein